MRPTRPPPTTRRPRWGRVQQHQHHSTQRRAAPRHPHHATPRFNTPPRRTARRCFIHRPFSLSPEETTASGRQHFARMRTSLLHLAHCPCPLIHPTTTTYRAPQDPNFRPANWPPFPKSCYWPMSVLELILDLFGPLTPDLVTPPVSPCAPRAGWPSPCHRAIPADLALPPPHRAAPSINRKPCFHHDFQGEIPEWGYGAVRMTYGISDIITLTSTFLFLSFQ